MKRKNIWARIACMALMASSLSACSLFGGDENLEAAEAVLVQEPISGIYESQAPSSVVTESPEPAQGDEQESSERVSDLVVQEETTDVEESSAATELSEIEIPAATTKPESKAASEPSHHESAATESSEPSTPSETPSTPAPQPTTTPTPQPESGDVKTADNGDILLPEVP